MKAYEMACLLPVKSKEKTYILETVFILYSLEIAAREYDEQNHLH